MRPILFATLALVPALAGAAPLVNPGFEEGLRGWTKTGTAFDFQPTYSENVQAHRVKPVSLCGDYWTDLPYPIGVRGKLWIGTYEKRPGKHVPLGTVQGEAPTGTLTSAKFTISPNTKFISFLIGGGQDLSLLKVELLEASLRNGALT